MSDRARRTHWPINVLSVVFVAILLIGAFPGPSAADSLTQLYIGHRARLTADIPADWRIPGIMGADYSGSDGFVISYALPGDRLEDVCRVASETGVLQRGTVSNASWRGEDSCHIDGIFEEVPAVGLVIPHGRPFSIGDEMYRFAVVVIDPGHFGTITDSISFDPALVTPSLYVGSVLDLIEARAWYAPDVDWHRLRDTDEPLVRNAETLEETHWVIRDALTNLRYWGDNHSLFIADASTLTANKQAGLGLMVNRRIVILVYPGGPAAEAGIRVGDTIEAVDGSVFNGTRPLPAGEGAPVTLQIRRVGARDPMMMAVIPGPYSLFMAPRGERVAGEIGYVELFGNFQASGTEKEYATAAYTVIKEVDRPGTCGWIVDLRRDMGGNYVPMVEGIAPILGDGLLLSWVFPDGRYSNVELRKGRIVLDGQEAPPLIEGPMYTLARPNPPVAVLIGPYTASSGEATTLALAGRPVTRLFGESTGGYTTANMGHLLFDGAMVLLAEALMADRHGDTYMRGIKPDEVVRTDWAVYGTADDPVIHAATAWLEQQPGCGGIVTPVATPAD